MDEKKLLFLYHADSGKGKIKNKLSDILNLFVSAGYTVTVRPTQARGDATDYIMKHASEYERIICSGGDGTLDEVVNGFVKADCELPIGYIPTGSTNDFASGLGISKNPLKAAKDILYGDVFACDMGIFDERPFIYVAAFGLWTEVSYETDQKFKNAFGHMAYVLEGIRSIGNIRSYPMQIVAGDTIIKDEFIYGMVSNSNTIGGYKIFPKGDVVLDDGEFEVLLVKSPRNPGELNEMITSLLAQEMDPEYLYYFKASEIEFISEEEIPWTLDGENGGAHKSVILKNRKQAIKIYTGKKR